MAKVADHLTVELTYVYETKDDDSSSPFNKEDYELFLMKTGLMFDDAKVTKLKHFTDE